MKPLFALAALICLPLSAQAQDALLSRQFTTCMERTDGVTMAMIECINAETQRQDDQLNQAYKALRTDLTPTRRQQLLEAQRAWIRFRDANCAFYDDPEGGTLARVLAHDCVMRMTAQRTQELKDLRGRI